MAGGNSMRKRGGTVMVVASAAGFATMPVLAKVAYEAGASVLTVLSYRFLIAAVLLGFSAAVFRSRGRLEVRVLPILFGLGLAFVCVSLTMFVALTSVPAGFASLIFYTYPALVAIGSFFVFGERLGLLRLALIVGAVLGCCLLLGGAPEGRGLFVGGALAFASAVFYALYILVGYSVSDRLDPVLTAAFVAAVSAVCFAVPTMARGDLIVDLPRNAWLAMAGIAVLSTTLALYAFLAGARLVGPSAAAMVSTVEPAITVSLAALFLGERLEGAQYLGGAFVVVVVVGLQLEGLSRIGKDEGGAVLAKDEKDLVVAQSEKHSQGGA